ncbi:MAG: hypothetical protein KDC61_16900, partial [Saprospiraceae bacterium]|nr:hypothetical protein [Saprospiraceae bacterium]
QAQMKLDEFRMQKEQECTDKVNMEAQRRFDEIVAQREAEAAKTGKKSSSTKKSSTKGPKVDPLPQPTKPSSTPSKDKWSQDGNATQQPSKEKWTPAQPDGAKPAESPSKSKWQKSSGGGGK